MCQVCFLKAAATGNVDKVKACFDLFNYTYAENENGQNLLHFAASEGHLEIVKYLMDRRYSDKDAKDNNGWTSLHFSIKHGFLEIVKYLIERCKVDKEAKDNDGRTALHFAARFGNLEVVKYLIQDCGADISVTCNEGETPYDIALDYGTDDVTDYIERRLRRTALSFSPPTRPHHLANAVMDPACLPIVSPKALPTIDEFPDVFTIGSLPWYAIVVGAWDLKTAWLKETHTYQNIRDRSKFIPLEVLYFKLLETFQQPNYTDTYRSIPTREDQLLFVTAEYTGKQHGHVFRPLPTEARDSLVATDIQFYGGRRRLSTAEKKEHLGIAIQLKRRALDAKPANIFYQGVVASMLSAIERMLHDAMDDEEIAKHHAQIKDTWERYFPTTTTTTNCNNKKRKTPSDDSVSSDDSVFDGRHSP